MNHCTDLNLCDTVGIFMFFFLFDSCLNLLNGFDGGVTVKTHNNGLARDNDILKLK